MIIDGGHLIGLNLHATTRPALTGLQGNTHGHAEDRLLGLVNITGTHFEDSAKETGCKKKERRWKECQEERDTGDNEEEKGREKAGRGARKKNTRPPGAKAQSGSPGGLITV